MQIPPGLATDKGVLASVFMGLAISPDNKVVYVAGGQQNKIYLFSVDSGAKLDSVNCTISENGKPVPDGYIGDMDDAQNGVDHVDAHRSILMVISPYAKKNYVSKVH
jgi:hypothetical protein